MKVLHAVVGGTTLLLLAGCTVHPARPFGAAVREMTATQVARPAATPGAAAEGGDPELIKSAVDVLRQQNAPRESRPGPR